MATTEHGDTGERTGLEVAVVGMAGRFPGADDIHAFWRNLREGVESISFFTREELLAAGGAAEVLDDPHFVPAGALVPGADELDAGVFGMTPRDAEILNPQHRLFLECAWSALEHAGYDPARVERPVGVFAGSGINSYLERVAGRDDLLRAVGRTRIVLSNDKDHLASGAAYRLNLRGPAMAVQTACSTSLVAVHVACQSLINGECDVALAGGAAVSVPFRTGYMYSPDGIASPDGHCRAFDAEARGTVRGNGAGVVVLRRLEDAIADGDTIHAVIRGSAINNDGAQKVGYTAPSVTGQARVILEALSVAGVDGGTMQYLETHGSGTQLGDAIELKALAEVLARHEGGHPWAIGSVKTNVGHMDAAAGVTGLIKTVLAMGNREIPPSLNCAVPHPEIQASGGRVFVNTELRPWARNGSPRRAGVSSFGIGGTNAHVVLEEAPAAEPSGPSREPQLLVLSARTPTALAKAAENLAAHLESASPSLADAAFTLRTGRAQMEHRLAVVCRDAAEGARRLREAAARGSSAVPRGARPVAFLFPGVGMQYVDMGRGLYDAEPVFRGAVDECCALLRPVLGSDLRDVLFSASPESSADGSSDGKKGGGWNLRRLLGRSEEKEAPSPLDDTRVAQPAVFVIEYALAKLWTSWGVRPSALAGHSLGEYVAACVAGVLRLEDALHLVATRAKLIDALPGGAMVAVPMGEAKLREILPAELDVAAVNTPESCVVSGSTEAIEAFEAALSGGGTVSRRIPTTHAFHSRAMAAVAAEVERLVAGFELHAPEIPFVSGVTGTWITDEEARSPAYWSRHLCRTVRFADAVATLRGEPGRALLEVGPGQALGAWAMQHPAGGAPGTQVVLSSLRHQHNRVPDARFLLESLAGLWTAGGAVDWAAFRGDERRMRIPLPGYAFERQRYWVDPRPAVQAAAEETAGTAETRTMDKRPAEGAVGGPDLKGPEVMDERLSAAQAAEAARSPREEALLGVLKEIVSDLTGIDREQVETNADLFQVGLDSLLLLQSIQAIEKRVGVRLSLIELLEDIATLGALAAHLDHVLPPGTEIRSGANGKNGSNGKNGTNGKHDPAPAAGISCAAPPPAVESPAAAPSIAAPAAEVPRMVPAPPAFYPSLPASPSGAGVGDGALERLFAQQIQAMSQLMAQQIAAVSGAAAHPAAPAPAAHPAAPAIDPTPTGAHSAAPAEAVYASPAAVAAPAFAAAPAGGATSPMASASAIATASATTVIAHPAAPADTGYASRGEGVAVAVAGRVQPRVVEQAPRAKIQPETFVPYQVVNPEGRNGMTPRQREYLEGFIARFVAKTGASKAHQVRYHAPLADTRVSAKFRRAWKEILYPIVSQRALGSRVWDLDGNEYVDTGMSFGCNLFGHAPEFVSRAIRDQVERGYGVGPQSPHAGRAAELICELGGNDRAVFCNSGTEAVMGAIRAARTFSGRNKIAVFSGSYHGWADVVLGRLTTGGKRELRPSGPGISPAPLQDVMMLEWDDPKSLEVLAEHMDELALVMVEPVQSRRLDIHPRAFLHELRRITREGGVLLHFDELITGFRVHPGGAQAHFGVQADLVTYGKIVAGGLPMGVVAGRKEVMDVFDGGVFHYGDDSYPTAQRTVFAGAFFKHPLSMAVACSILEEIRRQGQPMYDALNERTTKLVARLNAFFEAGRYPMTAVRFSSSFRFFYGPEFQHNDLFNHHLVLDGIYMIPETGTHFLSTAHTDEDLETFFQAVKASVEGLRRGGFIPDGPDGGAGESSPDPSPLRVEPTPSATTQDGSPGASPTTRNGSADVSPATMNGGSASAADSSREVPASVCADRSTDGARGEGARVLPVSEGQRQLWVESQMGEDAGRAYVESSSIRLRSAVDVDAMRAAVAALVARHDTLRMTFGADGDTQRVHAAMEVGVPLEDLRGIPSDLREERLEAWVRGEVRRPFDLVAGPLVRFALAALADDEHLLVIAFHHAVLDGRSAGVVTNELGELYAALRDGRTADLPARPDHAEMVRAQAAAASEGSPAEAYWLARFADGVPVLELPTDRPRPPVRSYRGGRVVRVIGGGVARRLAEAGRPRGLTLFHTLFSAYAAWLARLGGEDDVVIGTPAAGQSARAGAADLVGYAINILPVRVRVDASLPFAEHARAARRALMGALENQDFSFARLVRALPGARDPGRHPVFSASMNLDHGAEEVAFGGMRGRFESNFAGGAKVDLHFELAEIGDALHLRAAYVTDLFDRETVERWTASFERLLEQLAEDVATPLADLELVGAEERETVIGEWNRTATAYPRGVCVHELFEARVRERPEAEALAWGGESLTYRDLDARANRLARHLRGLGVGPESRVGVLLERGTELVVSLLAILKAGGCYVPLDPTYPAERLGLMLADAGARVLLTRGDPTPAVAAGGVSIVPLDRAEDALAAESEEAPRSGATADNLAYIVYTSGSTGRPKGVMVGHREIVQLVRETDFVRLAPGDRVAQASNASFDALAFEAWGALLNGATLVGIDRDVLLSPPALRDLLRAEGITTLYQTTALLNQLSREQPDVFSSLREVLFGGQASDADRVRALLRTGKPRRLLHVYGPTETTAWCTCEPVEEVPDGALTVSVGRPIANARIYVLDAALRPVPVGVPGEAYVGGGGVVRGYLDRPALTAERFVPDPFADEPGARMYRTGDRLRWKADGTLEFAGRLDDQVKIRGFRIEPGEVESVLAAHSWVEEARVIVREDEPGVKRLVAYVVGDVNGPELREHLRRSLPEYMVPSAFVVLDRLPLTPSGKLDVASLPAPDFTSGEEEYQTPRNAVEEALAAIWAEVLRVERVGIHDDFFELGGDSILAIQVVSRARRAGVAATPRQLFEHPTVARLAAAAAAASEVESRPAEQGRVSGAVAPTPIQAWFFEQEQPAPWHHNQSTLLAIDPSVEGETLETALLAVLEHHDALRLRFRKTDGGWEQWHADQVGIALERIDLSALPADDRDRARTEIAGERQASLDLEQGPLGRAVLFDRGEEGRELLVILHHLVVDSVSWRILREDLERAVAQVEGGGSIDLGAKTTSYREWAEALGAYAASGALAAESAFWLAQGGDGVAPLPVDGEGGATVAESRAVFAALDEEETRALLQEVPAAYRTQVNDILLCALAATVGEWAGGRRFRIALEGHGREEEIGTGVDLTRTVGWFTSVYPVVLDTADADGPGERLKQVKETLRAVPTRGIGYGALRYLAPDASLRRALGSQAEPEISFNYLGRFDDGAAEDTRLRSAGGARGREWADANRRRYLLEVDGAVSGGCLRLSWRYGEGTHRRETVERLAEAYLDALRTIIAHCREAEAGGYTPSDFPLAGIGQAELDAVLADGEGAEDLYPLSPMQEGMLYHALAAGGGEQPYQVQVVQRLEGHLDVELFRRAWAEAARRHAVLRTSFVWDGVPRPLQRVRAAVEIPWEVEDWSHLSEDEQRDELRRHLASDRACGFEMDRAPLLRFVLIRLSDDAHWVAWNQHHALLDGWASSRVIAEVMSTYEALAAGRAPRVSRVRPYRDFIAWLQGRDPAAAERYWSGVLAGFRAPTPLPAGRPAELGAPVVPASFGLVLSEERTRRLGEAARRMQVTLNTLLQGAWGLLLSRYSGEDDVVFGTTVSGRPAELEGVEEMVGVFINTLPVRMRVSPAARVGEWLAGVQRAAAEAREHETASLVQVQGWSEVPRGTPLFESHFIFENYPVDPAGGAGSADERTLRAAPGPMVDWNTYPLSLMVDPGRELSISLSYDRNRFGAPAIERMLAHLDRVLEQLAGGADLPLSAVTLLDGAERAEVVDGWNRTAADFPADRCIHQLFEEQAERTPDAPAVVFEGESLTFRELDERANRIASHLASLGVGPEVRVGLCLERGLEMMACILGVMKAGGAYVPVDPAHPAERNGYVLEDSGIAVLLTQEKLADALPVAERVRIVLVDRDRGSIESASAERPRTAVTPENLAYVIYTSGSTGRPKGVAMHHRGVCNYIHWGIGFYGSDRGNGAPVFSSMAVDLTITNLLPLFAGRPVRFLPEENAVEALAEALRGKPGFGAIKITPVHLALLTPMLTAEEARDAAHTLVIGADFLPAEPTVFWQDHAPGVRLMNEYGPTETVVGCSAYVLPNGVHRSGPVPVGGAIQNLRFYVLDARGEPVPVGVPGELYIGGVGVARGYLGRPGLTAEKFVPDPFAEAGARMYRSGDRARWLEGGSLTILGRTDSQVKIRGYRVELGEVEAVLRRHPAVSGCLAVVREDRPGDRRLVAYVAAEDEGADAAALREHLRRSLPEHMVPAAFVMMPVLPNTATGKIDPRTLPPPEYEAAEDGYVAPSTPVEEVLAELWAEVLGVERVGARDDFFELGGHSLLVMRLLSRIRARFGLRLSVHTVFAAWTLEAMAAEIERLAWEKVAAMPEAEAEAQALAALTPAEGG